MLPPVVVIVAIALKVPAIPGLTLGLFSGALLGVIFKDGTSFKVLIDTCYGGFGLEKEFVFSGAYNDEVLKTVNAAIKELLGNLDPEAYDTTGGISNMGGTIALIMIAMMYGGVMEGTGMLGKFVEKIKKIVKTPAGLVSVAEGTCIFSNVAMPDQYVSIIIGGRMYAEDFDKMDVYPAALSNALESSATITSALVPWNTCGAYMEKTLGIKIWGAGGFGPWAIFNWLMPVMNVILAYLGVSVADKNGVRLRKKKRLAKKAARV